jgi:hypothetical protein
MYKTLKGWYVFSIAQNRFSYSQERLKASKPLRTALYFLLPTIYLKKDFLFLIFYPTFAVLLKTKD